MLDIPAQSEFLSKDELAELTGFSRVRGQEQWLRERSVPHRADGGRVIISRVHVREWLEGKTRVISRGPNWAAVR